MSAEYTDMREIISIPELERMLTEMVVDYVQIPWVASKLDAFSDETPGFGGLITSAAGSTPVWCAAPEGKNTAELIATAVNALPALLQAVRIARQYLDTGRGDLDGILDCFDFGERGNSVD